VGVLEKIGEEVAIWKQGDWPSSKFNNVMNVGVNSHFLKSKRSVPMVQK
jgi:hypothetical protein